MVNEYRVIFLDALPLKSRLEAWIQVRKLQSRMSLPIRKAFVANHRSGALRSNVLDDFFEFPAYLTLHLGRSVVALRDEEVVGFMKAPIRLPLWLAKVACSLWLRSTNHHDRVQSLLATPGIEIWCINSMGVNPRHQGHGIPRRLISLAATQSTKPAVVVTGHEAANLASRRLHQMFGLSPTCCVQVLHMKFFVYFMTLNISSESRLSKNARINLLENVE